MSVGFIGYVMKNNMKISSFPCTVTTLIDGSQRVTYDAFDFIGLQGIKRRDPRHLFLTKKRYPITKIFRYNTEWDTLTDRGCISYWDQTSQAQIPAYALTDVKTYQEVAEKQKKASDVLYYCLDADALIDKLMATPQTTSLVDMLIPALLIGGIILTAVMNIYASSQYLQAWGVIKGTSGVLGNLQAYFEHMAGLPVASITMFPELALLKKSNKKMPKPQLAKIDTVTVVIKEKELVVNQLSMPLYLESYTAEDGQTYQNKIIILNDQKQRYKLVVNTDEKYSLKGTRDSTIFILYQREQPVRFKQLSLSEMGMDPKIAKPINEDMGKVLAKIYQDNLNAKKKPQSMIAGLTKGLFYVFILSIAIYAIMFGINMYLTSLSVHAFASASSAINHFITILNHSQYRIAPIANASSANTI
ncbi:MAG: hypothetical protein QXY10_01675 [Candidatus Micrarchaeaceae archaeon]